MMSWQDGHEWWMLAVNAGFALVLMAVLIAVLLMAGRGAGQLTAGAASGERSAALVILDERFARGEIDEDEFRRRVELLRL